MAVVAAFLQQQDIVVYLYIDDWLLVGGLPQCLLEHLDVIWILLAALGLRVNISMSKLELVQVLQFIRGVLTCHGSGHSCLGIRPSLFRL